MSHFSIRRFKEEELNRFEDILYEAIFQPDENNLLPRDIVKRPELSVYIDDWGKPDDVCLVADIDGELVGAVWTRVFKEGPKGYGYVDSQTPELAISLFKPYRNKGIGTALMKEMIEELKKCGYRQVSLSVEQANYAADLYKKLGFRVLKEKGNDYLMLLELK